MKRETFIKMIGCKTKNTHMKMCPMLTTLTARKNVWITKIQCCITQRMDILWILLLIYIFANITCQPRFLVFQLLPCLEILSIPGSELSVLEPAEGWTLSLWSDSSCVVSLQGDDCVTRWPEEEQNIKTLSIGCRYIFRIIWESPDGWRMQKLSMLQLNICRQEKLV